MVTRIKSISVVGLGKLGLCIAAVLADAGFKVVGVDVDEGRVRAVNSGEVYIKEPKLPHLIRKNRNRIRATTSLDDAIESSQATFVIVPTPSEPDGSFSLKHVLPVVKEAARAISRKDEYHLMVINSTIMPGSMDNYIKPTLEEHSGKLVGNSVGLCYNPEFVALGDVINGLTRPDLVLIGESDPVAGSILERIQKKICKNDPEVIRTNFINAEIAKIAINSYITMKISFANMLAEICERVPGASVDEVTRVLASDSRIGGKYLKGGIGYGGPCFPRDNIAFASFAKSIGIEARLPLAAHQTNLHQPDRVLEAVRRFEGIKRIGILGLSYKPGTPVVEESQSLIIADRLVKEGYEVHVFDPLAMDEARKVLGNAVYYEESLESCVKNCEMLILATPWEVFKNIDTTGKVVIDCWRHLSIRSRKKAKRYIALGVSNDYGQQNP